MPCVLVVAGGREVGTCSREKVAVVGEKAKPENLWPMGFKFALVAENLGQLRSRSFPL
jgi:hypothetical protein